MSAARIGATAVPYINLEVIEDEIAIELAGLLGKEHRHFSIVGVGVADGFQAAVVDITLSGRRRRTSSVG